MTDPCPVCNENSYELSKGDTNGEGAQIEPDMGHCYRCGFNYSEHGDDPESAQVERHKLHLAKHIQEAAYYPGTTMDIIEVLTEMREARKKFSKWPTDPIHAAAVVAEEAGEVVQAALQYTYEQRGDPIARKLELRKELIQTAAMALRALALIENYEPEEKWGKD